MLARRSVDNPAKFSTYSVRDPAWWYVTVTGVYKSEGVIGGQGVGMVSKYFFLGAMDYRFHQSINL